jgi:addiction module HigA family antidote
MVVHPGERLMFEVLLPAQVSIQQAADQLEISADTLAESIRRRFPITDTLAVRLAREFGYSRESWLALQSAWDMEQRLLA